MTYEMAFIMVGRVFLWAALITSVPIIFILASLVEDCPEDRFWVYVLGCFLYAVVIVCARYVQ